MTPFRRPAPFAAVFSGFLAAVTCGSLAADLELGPRGYFESPGLDVIVFDDIYPEGHQTGVTVIQHGVRVAANGDLRLEASPGQWSPVPVAGERTVAPEHGRITQALSYPDPARDRKGFNPIVYPDLELAYRVTVEAGEGDAFTITVDLDEPLPDAWAGRVGFNFELFPGDLFGKAWLMDGESGHFPNQPDGPLAQVGGEWLTAPLARGRTLVVAPESDLQRLVIESHGGPLELLDGRANHNNGWFIVRTAVPAGATRGAVRWTVRANAVPGWRYAPVVQVSQLGYAPTQPKRVVIEQDRRDSEASPLTLYRLAESGRETVRTVIPQHWEGSFLRYAYLVHDFSDVTAPGMYQFEYRGQSTQPFRIAVDTFARHAWQPTLEYYLPVQMCHVRVNEKYRAWHDFCHLDDARMAPLDHNHFDGYLQGASTLTKYSPGQPVPGLNAGGWHDAGDYDLRVESQIGTVWVLAQAVEEFGLEHDATSIDPQRRVVEIHQSDGRPDALQQIEHGLRSVLGGYRSLGRLYRGIIAPTQRQYVLLGDASAQTDNRVDPAEDGSADDRWVFTEDNPDRELYVAGGLAAAARVLRGYDDALAAEALAAAQALYAGASERSERVDRRVFAASELLQATGDAVYAEALVAQREAIVADIASTGWVLAKALPRIDDKAFLDGIAAAVAAHQAELRAQARETPYGVPYRPRIWGAGWDIQAFGVRQYFFRKGWPDHAPPDLYLDALNFVLGVHPGSNTMSFVSGVGSRSALVAYGVNRADWSHIPGGVISGTALIRPDLPELKTWPFFWQQTEYVMGGGGTNFLFLALAADAQYGR